MKFFSVAILSFLVLPSLAEANCSSEKALKKADVVFAALSRANKFDPDFDKSKITESAQHFNAEKSFDTGTSVFTYTVRVSRLSCLVLGVRLSVNEG